ncbi:MAG: hypothetical protein K8R56_00955 [Candidatus Eisenbacteria bacterium]|nr:hypothetical protein [Candidatus Eisenbacteria bacterium]
MKRLALAAVLTLAVTSVAVPAHATGIALRWLSCVGSANRNFACDRSTGSELLVGSFEPPAGINKFVGIEASVRVVSASNVLPAWWQFRNAGSCRQNSLSLSFDMSDQMECEDPWQGQASGGIGRYLIDGSNSGELLFVGALPPEAVHPVTPGTTYAAFKLIINHQRTTGGGACAGCESPVCIRFVSAKLVMPSRVVGGQNGPPGNQQVTEEQFIEVTQGISGMGGSANIATWQGGAASCSQGGSKPASWKQLKDLYRSK